MSVVLSPLQTRAATAVADWFRDTRPGDPSKFYLGGLAGSGKSTLLPTLMDYCNLDPQSVAFCAPTGKAAKVMTTKLRSQFGAALSPAKTIHSLIYTPRGDLARALEKELNTLTELRTGLRDGTVSEAEMKTFGFDSESALASEIAKTQTKLDAAYVATDDLKFTLNTESPIAQARLIVVDEASMVGKEIATDLMSFGVPVLAIGDPGQLPPVKDEAGLTLGDPDFFLDEIHRQAADNPIIWLAHLARQGKSLPLGKHGTGVRVVRKRDDQYTYDLDRCPQIICGTNKTRWAITRRLRKAIGIEETGPVAGEPLVVCKNSKKIPDLVNGSLAEVTDAPGDLKDGRATFQLSITDEGGVPRTVFAFQSLFEEHHLREKGGHTCDGREFFRARTISEHLDWGYVLTGHKSQGSQFEEVIVHDESSAFREDASRWLYTAATRAEKYLTIVTP